jgi:hypothetical protein
MFADIGDIIAKSEKRCKREPPARRGSFTRRAILKKGGGPRFHLRGGKREQGGGTSFLHDKPP